MRHRIIKDVFTIIFQGRQRIGFETEGLNEVIYLSYGNVKQCTGIKINEVEILIGSKIRPEFYQVGEKMLNGKICDNQQTIIKDFWIECEGTYEEMKSKNLDKLKPLLEIKKVFQFNRNGQDVVGFETGKEKAIFIFSNRLKKLTKLNSDEFHILEGSFINPEYYQVGEEIYGGGKCYKSDSILKALNLRFYGKFEEMHERFENSALNYVIGNYNSLNSEDEYNSRNWLANSVDSDDSEMMSVGYWNMD